MSDPTNGYYLLGYIGRAHGIQGQLRLVLDVQYPQDYAGLTSVWVAGKAGLHEMQVAQLNLQGYNEGIIQLVGVTTRDAADALVGSTLHLPLSQLPALKENQFYYHDIIGYSLIDTHTGVVGTIAEVRAMPGQDVLVVAHASGAEVLVPLVDAWLPVADHAARSLTMQLPAGLVEVYLKAPDPKERDDDQ